MIELMTAFERMLLDIKCVGCEVYTDNEYLQEMFSDREMYCHTCLAEKLAEKVKEL